ncbi:MAG: hypothetical protein GTO17_08050 [Candidatus Aminicenantes bacterium]|nr:hypothetical protein [Candidatus Aminicenantes bacterium]
MKTIKNLSFPWLILCIFSIPLLLIGGEFQVKSIQSSRDLPEKICKQWKRGDFLISDGKYLALIGNEARPLKPILSNPLANARGSIISFVPAGKNLFSDLGIGAPVIKIGHRMKFPIYSSLKQSKKNASEGSLRFEAEAQYEEKDGKKAKIKTLYTFSFQKGRIDIISTLKNTGSQEFEDLSYDLYFKAFHSYYSNPFDKEKHPTLRYRVYQKNGHYLAWLNLNPYQETPPPGKLAPGRDFKVHYILLVDVQPERLLRKIYRILKIEAFPVEIQFEDFEGKLLEVLVKDADSDSVFFRSFLKKPAYLEIALPKGAYLARANFFPAVREKFFTVGKDTKNSCTLSDRPQGTLKAKIQNSKGEFVPGKVTFLGLESSKSPYFMPENPVETGRDWERHKNSVYPSREEQEVRLPVGTYLLTASRGPEYSLDQEVIEVLKGDSQEIVFVIDRMVDTSNLLSLDLHLHTQNSLDAALSIPERIKSLIAEGVEVAVATDHNYITDYYPALKKLGLDKYLAVISGSEVTHNGVIHFCTYPLIARTKEENNGALDPRPEEASLLFKASRQKNPKALIQVNHPRSKKYGYFTHYYLDQESAAHVLDTFDTSFDVMEVINGTYRRNSDRVAVKDWLNLLNRGYYFPLVGASDSHGADTEEPGYARTYVHYEGEKGKKLDWTAVREALKKGRSFASTGPIIEFKINGKYTCGDSFKADKKKIHISLLVQSAPWVAVDEVRIIVNGERKMIIPVNTEKSLIQKLHHEMNLKLKRDSYIAIEALGKKSFYPVVQRRSRKSDPDDAVLPYALTNPVFIDVDGNGKFDPPVPEKIKLITDIPKPKDESERN